MFGGGVAVAALQEEVRVEVVAGAEADRGGPCEGVKHVAPALPPPQSGWCAFPAVRTVFGPPEGGKGSKSPAC